jgi:hypothetical protein
LFSPDPGPALTIAYEIKKSGQVIQQGEWPEPRNESRDVFEHNRKLATVRFIWRNPYLLKNTMGRHFCQKYPDADTVSLSIRRYRIPTEFDVASGQKLNERKTFEVDRTEQVGCASG